ncbi:MAG: hypothetical protein KDC38_09560, partial [Planctomycetes bacterium]|nr:hypothetical protein [Planctomycetota bacterium]
MSISSMARLPMVVLALLLASPWAIASNDNLGTGRVPVFGGHQLTMFAGPGAPDAILYAPSAADDPGFRADLAASTGAIVDYFDARFDTPVLDLLRLYDAVYTWIDGPCADTIGFGDVLADYVDDGGTVVLGAFCTYTSGFSLAGRIMAAGYCPVDSLTGANHYSLAPYAGDGRAYLHDCIVGYEATYRDELVLQGSGQLDGTYTDGEIAAAFRPDRRVVYTNGLYLAGGGQWIELLTNALTGRDRLFALVYDGSTYDSTFALAASELGYNSLIVDTEAAFLSSMSSGAWDVVVMEVPGGMISVNAAAALSDYITMGGHAIVCYWDWDGSFGPDAAALLRSTFGIAATVSLDTPAEVYAWRLQHPLWDRPHDVVSVPVEADYWSDNGDKFQTAFGAIGVGGYTSSLAVGEAAVVLANNGRTIANGFLPDDLDDVEASHLAMNQLR